MKIEEGDRDMAGYCWSAPAISTLEVTEDPMCDISYQSPSLQIWFHFMPYSVPILKLNS